MNKAKDYSGSINCPTCLATVPREVASDDKLIVCRNTRSGTLKPSSLVPYNVYLGMLALEIGARRIDACDGRDAKRWFKAWSEPATEGDRPRIAAARMAMTVLKSALSFGKICRLHGCAEFKSILDEFEFPSLQPRTASATAEQVIKARGSA